MEYEEGKEDCIEGDGNGEDDNYEDVEGEESDQVKQVPTTEGTDEHSIT